MQPLWAARRVSGHSLQGQAPWGRVGSLQLGPVGQEVGRRYKEREVFLGEALRGSVRLVSRDSALSTPKKLVLGTSWGLSTQHPKELVLGTSRGLSTPRTGWLLLQQLCTQHFRFAEA